MNRTLLVSACLVHAVVAMTCGVTADDSPTDRPNILWITLEDMSPNLGCYGDDFAVTPNIDALAAEGVRYPRV